jgi:hypothetical protein
MINKQSKSRKVETEKLCFKVIKKTKTKIIQRLRYIQKPVSKKLKEIYAACRARTYDILVNSQTLYQLS